MSKQRNHGPTTYKTVGSLPRVIPLFPLSGALLLPRVHFPLNVFEQRYLAMVDDALAGDRLIGMIQPRTSEFDDHTPEIYQVGCAGRLTQFSETNDGRYGIVLTGICRFTVQSELDVTTPYRQAAVSWAEHMDDIVPPVEDAAIDREGITNSLDSYFAKFGKQPDISSLDNAPAESLVNSLASICPFGLEEKQALLEAANLTARAEILSGLIQMAIAEDRGAKDGSPEKHTLQ